MAKSPVLRGELATLEPFDVDRHLHERYVSWLNDPATVRFSQQRNRRHSLESCRQYAAGFVESPNFFWAILAPIGDELRHVGTMTGYVNAQDGVGDVGILVGDPATRGRGVATAAWLLAAEFLLVTQGLRKMTAGTLGVNEPMIRLMRRVGMRDDGRRVAHVQWESRPVDVVYAAFFREEWLVRGDNAALRTTALAD